MILFVCSQGRIRSRTAEIVCMMGGLEARSCGIDADALVPVQNQLLFPAELVVCMEREHVAKIKDYMGAEGKPIISLGIRDEYDPFDSELIELLINTLWHQDERIAQALMRGQAILETVNPDYRQVFRYGCQSG